MGRALIDGEFIETKWGTVHYSKTGTHVVPRKEKDKK
ncbi:polymorphic toxin type 50 domain-containing protein [Staphylococcus delphini]|nr:polymorphic toxin type 50 domain-containing protein [Staphylococcus delphini]